MILTIEEVKEHLRIEGEEENNLIKGLITQSQQAAEDFCRVKFGETTDENGETTEAEAPGPVRLAVMLMVSHYYENRDNPDRTIYNTMRVAFENLLYPYRDESLMF